MVAAIALPGLDLVPARYDRFVNLPQLFAPHDMLSGGSARPLAHIVLDQRAKVRPFGNLAITGHFFNVGSQFKRYADRKWRTAPLSLPGHASLDRKSLNRRPNSWRPQPDASGRGDRIRLRAEKSDWRPKAPAELPSLRYARGVGFFGWIFSSRAFTGQPAAW